MTEPTRDPDAEFKEMVAANRRWARYQIENGLCAVETEDGGCIVRTPPKNTAREPQADPVERPTLPNATGGTA